MTRLNYNMLSCPDCANLLIDSLAEFERNKEVKTVSCTCCSFIGARKGFILLNREQFSVYRTKGIIPTLNVAVPA